METTTKLYSLNYSNVKTYLFALLFIIGNVALPQLCHLTPYGGPTLLPIYFFTLIAAYKYGFRVALLTAILSPIINHLLFGMPPLAVLPAILIKSTLLAGAAALAAHYSKQVSLLSILLAVLAYQAVGTAFEWMLTGSFHVAVQDFRIGIPGMLIQWFGGYALLKAIAKI
ncbi:ECF transporter S component [Bacteroides sp.]|uniref:ECF transporter S component n=1 Tax=Bacteroides sp. TaxID=29523 RepID=UPI001B6C5EC7|nr:ECF transporter S component [Bacteroides sp.]MBP6065111.1 ECF transporter S component [Bacteroides sp.]MBP6066875.1 ECF transporter S component [Bacteroides sp.]MBP6936195.1 ECF transporter S component [Bacteroides sp.]MBP8622359.1 ECF transporter S component [Bacteroides sp.]MBP9507920.1 ECF transporter S component [Bacteroides sp.]